MTEALAPPLRLAAVADTKRKMRVLLMARAQGQRLLDAARTHAGAVSSWVLRAARRLVGVAAPVLSRLARLRAGLRRPSAVITCLMAGLAALSSPMIRARLAAAGRRATSTIQAGLNRAATTVGGWLRRTSTGTAVADWLQSRAQAVGRAWVRVTNRLLIKGRLVLAVISGAVSAVGGLARLAFSRRVLRLLVPWRWLRVLAQMVLAAVGTRRGAPNSPPEGGGTGQGVPTPPVRVAPTAEVSEDQLSAFELAENRAARRLRQQQEGRARRAATAH